MFSRYVVHVFSEWLWNSPSRPYYYRCHLCFYIPHALYFYCKVFYYYYYYYYYLLNWLSYRTTYMCCMYPSYLPQVTGIKLVSAGFINTGMVLHTGSAFHVLWLWPHLFVWPTGQPCWNTPWSGFIPVILSHFQCPLQYWFNNVFSNKF